MNIKSNQSPSCPVPAPHPAQGLVVCLDALLAAVLLWADRLGVLRPLVAAQVEAFTSLLRALSDLFARFAAGEYARPVPATAAVTGTARRKTAPRQTRRRAAATRQLVAHPRATGMTGGSAAARRAPAAIASSTTHHAPGRHARSIAAVRAECRFFGGFGRASTHVYIVPTSQYNSSAFPRPRLPPTIGP